METVQDPVRHGNGKEALPVQDVMEMWLRDARDPRQTAFRDFAAAHALLQMAHQALKQVLEVQNVQGGLFLGEIGQNQIRMETIRISRETMGLRSAQPPKPKRSRTSSLSQYPFVLAPHREVECAPRCLTISG